MKTYIFVFSFLFVYTFIDNLLYKYVVFTRNLLKTDRHTCLLVRPKVKKKNLSLFLQFHSLFCSHLALRLSVDKIWHLLLKIYILCVFIWLFLHIFCHSFILSNFFSKLVTADGKFSLISCDFLMRKLSVKCFGNKRKKLKLFLLNIFPFKVSFL